LLYASETANLIAMTAASDLALLSSIRSQIDELQLRVTTIADQYASTPDSQIASELFSAERALRTVGRTIDRANDLLRRVH
jgi:hypothetical protein